MKRDLQFKFEWEDPQAARGTELRATWARLEIFVGDEPVTRLIDEKNRSIRDAVYGPLYPVAEWIAMNWWSLLHEVEAPGTSRWQTYARRHSLAAASEGFALPDLRIVPTGQWVELHWFNQGVPGAGVAFVNSGTLTLPAGTVRDTLGDFVAAVVARLENEGIAGTPLQEEWDALQGTSGEESDFCRLAAALGQDPYAMDFDGRQELSEMATRIPAGVLDEFVSATDFSLLENSWNRLEAILLEAARIDSSLSSIRELAERRLGASGPATPWELGYECARNLRKHLGLNGHTLATDCELADALRTNEEELFRSLPDAGTSRWGVGAMVTAAANGNPLILSAKQGGDSRRFAVSRALYESLAGAPAALVSRARSDRQQANRAFAAEFLAPAGLLRERIAHEGVDDEQIGDLADEFGVSAKVIEHQIENHRIAELAG
jgi:hypothetical protein